MAKALSVPYTSLNDVDAFFQRIENLAEPKPPKKIDSAWIESYGFDTAHIAALPGMLRWLKIIDEDGESTGVWNQLRADPATRQTTLEGLVKESYGAVFAAVEVSKATFADLRGAFVSAYSLGDVRRQVRCFLALCRHAGIETAVETSARESTREATKQPGKSAAAKPQTKTAVASRPKRDSNAAVKVTPERRVADDRLGFAISLNVEIPADWTEEQIRDRVAAVARAVDSVTE